MFNTSPDAAFIVRLDDWTIINVNDGFVGMLGFKKDEVINKNYRDFGEYNSDRLYKGIKEAMGGKGYCDSIELNLYKKNGDMITGLLSAKRITLRGIPHVSCNIRDITERKRMEDDLEYQSYHDHLTGLYNRRFFEMEVSRLDHEKTLPLSIIVGDINGVKLINDAFGHANGDKLIIETARQIAECSRSDDIVARTGGDEFALLMKNTDSKAAFDILTKIQNACKKHNEKISNETYHINVSLGCATKTSIEQDFNEIMRIADKYMYLAKTA